MAQNFTGLSAEAEQERVSDIIAAQKVRYPEGVRRIDYNFGEDWSGDPAVHIVLVVGKDLESTSDRVTELGNFMKLLREEIIDSHSAYWPYTRISVER